MTKEKETRPKKLTTEEATRKVIECFVRGLTRDHIVEHAKASKWGIKGKALDDVIERATQRLIDTGAALSLDTEVGKALSRLESLYKAAVDAKETKTALAVQKEINSLLRLGEHARRVPIPAREPKSGDRPRLSIAK